MAKYNEVSLTPVKAQKLHYCSNCMGLIKVGQVYYRKVYADFDYNPKAIPFCSHKCDKEFKVKFDKATEEANRTRPYNL